MKRFLCLILVLMLCCLLGTSQAGGVIPNLRDTPTPEPAAQVFSFRGGIRWDMSREQVKTLESVQLVEQNREDWSILVPVSRVEVSKFTADLVYIFYNDRLKVITYDFGAGGSDEDYQYLTSALDFVYGTHQEPAAADIKGVMDQIYPGYYSEESLLNRRGWKAGADTLIYLYYYSEKAWAILYVNAGSVPNYVTTGL